MGDAARPALDVPRIDKGLDEIYVKETSICFIDGLRGRLLYRGYDIRDLAEHSTFEETAYLLLNGRLPNRQELDAFQAELAAERSLPADVLQVLRKIPREATPMDVLRTGVSLLGTYDPDRGDASRSADLRRGARIIAKMPTLVAAYHRLREGRRAVAPDPDRGHAEDFLRMATGKATRKDDARVMDVAMVLYADHSMNASTFAATVAASTLADLYDALTAAIATLKGPLHGGAIEAACEMIMAIGRPEAAEAHVLDILRSGGKVFGFGHRVYKTYDPRALIFREHGRRLAERAGREDLFQIAETVQQTVVRELKTKRIYPNVDFYSGLVYHFLGIPTDLFTPIFAVARSVGWTAHFLEYREDNRILRPLDYYAGPMDLAYIPIDERP